MTELPEVARRAELLLAAPAGRGLLAELSGVSFPSLLDVLGLPYPPNIGRYTSEPSRGKRRRPRTVFGRRIIFDPLHLTTRATKRAATTHRAAVSEVSPDDARDAVRRVIDNTVSPRRVDVRDPAAVHEALSHLVEGFGFRGNEREYDGLLAAALDELRPVAMALVASPASKWWWDDLLREDQRFAVRVTDQSTGPPHGDQVVEQAGNAPEQLRSEEAAARSRFRSSSDVPANASGHWWSIPVPGMWTSRAVASVPALHLACAEETGNDPVVVWSLRISPGARVFEVREPSDWGRLVEMAPVDVTMSRLGDWRGWTGQVGPFYLPDWRVVAEHLDGIHVTVGGYLTTRSLPVRVGDGYSVPAGWDPDATLWLRDVFEATERVGEWESHFSFYGKEL
ncbi:MAG: hypothetical protein ACRDWE_04440 [Acidimicrobiales bacterium]